MLQLKLGAHLDQPKTSPQVTEYTDHLKKVRASGGYNAPEASLNLPFDNELLARVQDLASRKVSSKLKYHVVVGIGGSNLGTKAIYDALLGNRDLMQPDRFPKLLFAETTDPEWLVQLNELLAALTSEDELLVSVISKSGGTTETLANFEIIMEPLRAKFPKIKNRVVVITDDGSKLMQAAAAQSIDYLTMPTTVGGRYSVLSAVGLFPLLSVGINIVELRHGAQSMLNDCLDTDNLAARSAAVLHHEHSRGRTINDNFFFHPELESIGKWYRQLMGESIGKAKNQAGHTVHTGITPTVSLGSTDLHSVGQLYLGGPKDKITTFVSTATCEAAMVPTDRIFPDLVPMIAGKSAANIMTAILDGTKIAYEKADLPYMEVVLGQIHEAALGAYLQFKMLEMMYLGRLFEVNPFDQPSVEDYKIETKRLLEG